MQIFLMRHGQSMANTGDQLPHMTGDCNIGLTKVGERQSYDVGYQYRDIINDSVIYCSPYERTRQTLHQVVLGAGLPTWPTIYEDPRLREVERGYVDSDMQHPLRAVHGWFYYRHDGGESPADCYDRISGFLESMMRYHGSHDGSKNYFIVCHGMVIKCFVMRFMHLTVEQFESMNNPDNCGIVSICPNTSVIDTRPIIFSNKKWSVRGMTLRS